MDERIIHEMYSLKTRLSFRLQDTNFEDKKARDLRHNINTFFNKLEEISNEKIK